MERRPPVPLPDRDESAVVTPANADGEPIEPQ